ncbi:MAG: hypothetical protein ATN35_00330 [Epulopiscium sp. Nele67-Bin004]|nr:MAG: hypothetical protein ATN35_00330 [Epulopiscium sp. Nele67-Bin004]
MYLKLINNEFRVTPKYRPQNLAQDPITKIWLEEEVLKSFYNMNKAMQQARLSPLILVTGYRSFAHQKLLYNTKLENLERLMPSDDAQSVINVLPPGSSEFQAGLSVEVCTTTMIEEEKELHEFEFTFHKKWAHSNCINYGFVIRYPADKVHITKVDYKPYHFRYVGINHAKKMCKLNLCLEEYLNQYKNLRFNL